MKNALIFFYNIYIDNLKEMNNNYYFTHQDNNFVIMPFNFKLEEALEIYNLNKEMLTRGINTYKIILTSSKSVVFIYNDKHYILMIMPTFNNRIIKYEDIIKFNLGTNSEIKHLNKSNWPYYWENKIDFIEYQFLQFEKKFPLIKKSINYYIGLFENAITYFYLNATQSKVIQLAHRRISVDMDLLDLYNPLNIIVDYKERDIAEYFKSFIMNKSYSSSLILEMLSKLKLTPIEAILFISRLLFPSYYFDAYEDILNGKKDENIINDIVDRQKDFIYFIKMVFYKYSLYNVPLIEWIIKEE